MRYKQTMTQSTLAVGGFDAHSKTTRKAVFLARMDWTCPDSTDGLKVIDLLGIFNQIDLSVAVN